MRLAKLQTLLLLVTTVVFTPQAFAAPFKRETETWARVIREANIKVE